MLTRTLTLTAGQTGRIAISLSAESDELDALAATFTGSAYVRGENIPMEADEGGLTVPAMPPGLWPFEVRVGGFTALYGVFDVLPTPLHAAEGLASWAIDWDGADVASLSLAWTGDVLVQEEQVAHVLNYDSSSDLDNGAWKACELAPGVIPAGRLRSITLQPASRTVAYMTTDPVYLCLFVYDADEDAWNFVARSESAAACSGLAATTWNFASLEFDGTERVRLLPALSLADTSWPSDYSTLATCMYGRTVAVSDGSHLVKYNSDIDEGFAPALRIGYGSVREFIAVDLSYDPLSTNAQSGLAVAEAVTLQIEESYANFTSGAAGASGTWTALSLAAGVLPGGQLRSLTLVTSTGEGEEDAGSSSSASSDGSSSGSVEEVSAKAYLALFVPGKSGWARLGVSKNARTCTNLAPTTWEFDSLTLPADVEIRILPVEKATGAAWPDDASSLSLALPGLLVAHSGSSVWQAGSADALADTVPAMSFEVTTDSTATEVLNDLRTRVGSLEAVAFEGVSVTSLFVDQSFDASSANAQSGVAVAQAVETGTAALEATAADHASRLASLESAAADASYDAASANAQSGVAVAEAVAAEASLREAGDAALQSSLSDSAAALASADSELSAALTDEGAARESADAALDARVAALEAVSVDQSYDATSANAQSGVAVAQALAGVSLTGVETKANYTHASTLSPANWKCASFAAGHLAGGVVTQMTFAGASGSSSSMTTEGVYLALYYVDSSTSEVVLAGVSTYAATPGGTADTTWYFDGVTLPADAEIRALPVSDPEDAASWPSDYSALANVMRSSVVTISDGSWYYYTTTTAATAPAVAVQYSTASSVQAALESRIAAVEAQLEELLASLG